MIRYGVIMAVAISSVWSGTINEELVRRAMNGDGDSLYALGAKYANGRCLDRNDTMAYALWESVHVPQDTNLTAYVQTQKYKLSNRMGAKEINEGQKLSQDKEGIAEILKNLLSKLTKKVEPSPTK